jgi:hypothetical protein
MFPTCSEVLEVIRSLGYAKLNPANPTETEAAAENREAPNTNFL